VFDLFKIIEGKEVQVVHVSFTTGTPVEQKAVQLMASEGVKPAQATILIEEVHPAAKDVEGVKKPTKKQKQRLRDSMAKTVRVVKLDV
jgi:orotate phosphoribosyltransferase-like protein